MTQLANRSIFNSLDDVRGMVKDNMNNPYVRVYWKNNRYRVIMDKVGQYLISCNGHYVGLSDEYKPEDFTVEVSYVIKEVEYYE